MVTELPRFSAVADHGARAAFPTLLEIQLDHNGIREARVVCLGHGDANRTDCNFPVVQKNKGKPVTRNRVGRCFQPLPETHLEIPVEGK